MEYNTTRNHLEMKEYGRHIQKMVDHVLTIEDKERRQRQAHALMAPGPSIHSREPSVRRCPRMLG